MYSSATINVLKFSDCKTFVNDIVKQEFKVPICQCFVFQNRKRGFREEDFLRISSCLYSAKVSPPPHGGHVFRQIKISQTLFKKGHPKNNPATLFQNLTCSFRGEEF